MSSNLRIFFIIFQSSDILVTRLVEGDHKLGEQRRVRTEKYVKEERRKCNSVVGETKLKSMLEVTTVT